MEIGTGSLKDEADLERACACAGERLRGEKGLEGSRGSGLEW